MQDTLVAYAEALAQRAATPDYRFAVHATGGLVCCDGPNFWAFDVQTWIRAGHKVAAAVPLLQAAVEACRAEETRWLALPSEALRARLTLQIVRRPAGDVVGMSLGGPLYDALVVHDDAGDMLVTPRMLQALGGDLPSLWAAVRASVDATLPDADHTLDKPGYRIRVWQGPYGAEHAWRAATAGLGGLVTLPQTAFGFLVEGREARVETLVDVIASVGPATTDDLDRMVFSLFLGEITGRYPVPQ